MFMNLSRQSDEVVRRYYSELCDRIAVDDVNLQAFVPGTCNKQQICAQVDQLLEKYPEPATRPTLFAIPVGVKDIFHCDGFATRCGSDLPPELFQGQEAGAVTRLKAAGAVVMGKTATTEFAYFAPAATRNPANPDHTPGGSSSGSAAGVAAGFFEYALGSQTVGSVIRPAAYCGVVGFKPSYGRIDINGVVPFSPSADHVGIFGRRMTGLSPILKVLCHDWREASLPGRLRLGIPAGDYLSQTEAPALNIFHTQADRLADAGCDVVMVNVMDDIHEINERHNRLIAAEIARVHAPWFEARQNHYKRPTRRIIRTGMAIEEKELETLRPSCRLLRSRFSEAMRSQGLDAWLCPATTGEAPKGLATTGSPLMNLPWTHAGVPAVTLPAGKGPGGLPLGLQLVGNFMADEQLVALATQVTSILAP